MIGIPMMCRCQNHSMGPMGNVIIVMDAGDIIGKSCTNITGRAAMGSH